MPQSRPPGNGAASNFGDNWELRALTIAARLNEAADELRELIQGYRNTPDTSEGPVPDTENG